MDYEELRQEVEAEIERSGKKQVELAKELQVSRGYIWKAIHESGVKVAAIQKRILEHLTPYVIEETTHFQAKRKDS